jgi:two-component sensor histidine kinase
MRGNQNCSAVSGGWPACWRVALIVSELPTNAVRHGRQAGGAIRIELACLEDKIRCHVLSNGVDDMPVRQGRGSEIVSALARALGGSVSWTFTRRATIASVLFPSGRRHEELSRSAARA